MSRWFSSAASVTAEVTDVAMPRLRVGEPREDIPDRGDARAI